MWKKLKFSQRYEKSEDGTKSPWYERYEKSKEGTKSPWYESSMVRKVHKWYETSMVRKVYGTKSLAFLHYNTLC